MKAGDPVILIDYAWGSIDQAPIVPIKRVGTKYFYVRRPYGNREDMQCEIDTGHEIGGHGRALHATHLSRALARLNGWQAVSPNEKDPAVETTKHGTKVQRIVVKLIGMPFDPTYEIEDASIKVGDRVRVPGSGGMIEEGEIGTVIRIGSDYTGPCKLVTRA